MRVSGPRTAQAPPPIIPAAPVPTFKEGEGFANGIKGGVERVWLPQGIATHGCFCPAIKKDHLSDHHAIGRAGKPEQQFSYLFRPTISPDGHWHLLFQLR